MEDNNVMWKSKANRNYIHDDYEQEELKKFKKCGFEPETIEGVDAEAEFIRGKIIEQIRNRWTMTKFKIASDALSGCNKWCVLQK